MTWETRSIQFSSIQHLSADWVVVGGDWGKGEGMRGDSAVFSSSLFCWTPSWTVLAWAGRPLFNGVRPAFPLATAAWPTLLRALEDSF